MIYSELSAADFVTQLASKAPVPGGGGAAALIGSMGAALGNMVVNLTSGKKKYAAYEEDLQRILLELTKLQTALLNYIDEDAVAFYPLSQAYGIKANTDDEKQQKQIILQKALKEASVVPMKIVRTCFRGLEIQEELSVKGSTLAISDVACGVQALRTGLLAGRVNVMINLGMIKDQEFVSETKSELDDLTIRGVSLADRIFAEIENKLM
jgi:formiminotetrahydrofolate cyclodeaminase